MKVALVHPDLGLGGAERLVIDIALCAQEHGHVAAIHTPFHDPTRCFPEVAGARPEVRVHAAWTPFPRSVLGRAHALLAALRCAFVALYVCLFESCDVAVVDIVSLPVLVFAVFRVPVLFYCHFPDKELARTLGAGSRNAGLLRRVYRGFVDGAEEASLRFADVVVCNSNFTRDVFCATFPRLARPRVLYPCVALNMPRERKPESLLVSINRFERKKGISLAIEALASLSQSDKDVRLVVAGGYDARMRENVEHFTELKRLADARGVGGRVDFCRNISDEHRRDLLDRALAVLYTPANEHFGIVPLEAMAAGVAVVAVNSGGPVESIVHGITGYLCDPTGASFADSLRKLVQNPSAAMDMGKAGRERVSNLFSRRVMGEGLNDVLDHICKPR